MMGCVHHRETAAHRHTRLCRLRTGTSAPEIGGHFGGVKGQAISNLVGKAGAERLRDKELDRPASRRSRSAHASSHSTSPHRPSQRTEFISISCSPPLVTSARQTSLRPRFSYWQPMFMPHRTTLPLPT